MFWSPFWAWLKRQSQFPKGRRARVVRDQWQRKLYLEVLEARVVPSTDSIGLPAATTQAPATSHIDPTLLSLYQQAGGAGLSGTEPANPAGTDNLLQYDSQGRVAVTITATDVNQVLSGLQSLGFQLTASLPSDHEIQGYLPLLSILQTSQLRPRG